MKPETFRESSAMPQPLAEVFGFPPDNLSVKAERYRNNKLCPYNNKVPSCTKDKARDPLGVCSVYVGEVATITCPIRFRQDWVIAEDAARFFFGKEVAWTSLQEVRLHDAQGGPAGNVDFVLVAYDSDGRIVDFGSLEVQAVYISGNVRRPFAYYMADRTGRKEMDWIETNVRPDFLSSSRKRLLPQMLYKGSIFHAWGKKQAVALHESFHETLPELSTVPLEQAEVAWLVYGLDLDRTTNEFEKVLRSTIYTLFETALERITKPVPGDMSDFVKDLQARLDEELEEPSPPDAPTLTDTVIT